MIKLIDTNVLTTHHSGVLVILDKPQKLYKSTLPVHTSLIHL